MKPHIEEVHRVGGSMRMVWLSDYEALSQERDRLRGALQNIRDKVLLGHWDNHGGMDGCEVCDAYEEASAALGDKWAVERAEARSALGLEK